MFRINMVGALESLFGGKIVVQKSRPIKSFFEVETLHTSKVGNLLRSHFWYQIDLVSCFSSICLSKG